MNNQNNDSASGRKIGPFLDICPDYLNGHCPKEHDKCEFAHHPPTENGKVTVCVDYIKNGMCNYYPCKYYHVNAVQREKFSRQASKSTGDHTRNRLTPALPPENQITVDQSCDPAKLDPGKQCESRSNYDEQNLNSLQNILQTQTGVSHMPEQSYHNCPSPQVTQFPSIQCDPTNALPASNSELHQQQPQQLSVGSKHPASGNSDDIQEPAAKQLRSDSLTKTALTPTFESKNDQDGRLPSQDSLQVLYTKSELTEYMEVCRDFQTNACSRGSNCKYAHITNNDNVDIYNNRVKICKNEQCNDENCRNYHISKARPTSKSNTENDSSGDVAPMPESTASASTGGN